MGLFSSHGVSGDGEFGAVHFRLLLKEGQRAAIGNTQQEIPVDKEI